VVVILARVAAGARPAGAGQGPVAAAMRLPPGIGLSALALAATSGFLAFAGFEAAGSLGEEAVRPLRSIPAAIVGAVAFGGVFYVVCTLAQSLGFGTDPAGVESFQASQAPLGDLAERYVGRFLAVLLDAAACLSALGAALGGVTVGSRMLFALARDGIGPRRLAAVRGGTGVPAAALAVELAVALALLTGFRLAGTAVLDTFFDLATPGVLSLLVMYVLTNLGAARLLARRRPAETAVPVLGALVAAYVLVRNLWPVAPWPQGLLAVFVLVWVLVGIVLSQMSPWLRARTTASPRDSAPSLR
jgi:amino acid transporter